MARIQFGQSACQIEGTYVPSADFKLAGDDWIYFSHHHVLWTETTVQMQPMSMAGGWNRVRAGTAPGDADGDRARSHGLSDNYARRGDRHSPAARAGRLGAGGPFSNT